MSSKISIIMPTYNNEKTIHSAIMSILKQTFTDFEFIIINDGSTDNTKNIVNSISDPRIIFLDNLKNIGLPKRLNECLDISRGDFIARMDADDISFPDRIEKQFTFLTNNRDVDLVATRAAIFDDNNKILGVLPFRQHHQDIVRSVWNNIPMPHPTWMARKRWILQYKYAIPEVWRAEDQDLLLRAHKNSVYACLPEILLCYRQFSFDYKKNRIARITLLKAQFKYFLFHKSYTHIFLSLLVFFLKFSLDLCSSLLGCKTKFSQDIDDNIIANVRDLLGKS